MSSIAIILARGGSKRLPRKNILPLAGKPMIAWTIAACLESDVFDRVLVSTDDQEIANIALQHGAEVPFMRESAYDDHASSSEATLFALAQAESYWGESYSIVAQLMANCPFRSSQDIKSALVQFNSSNAPSQISAFRFGWMNPWWAAQKDEAGIPKWLFPNLVNNRSQDLPTLFCPTGALWIAEADNLKQAGNFYMEKHTLFEISWKNAFDIDDQDDFEMAVAFASIMVENN